MKPLCGRTIKGAVSVASIIGFVSFIVELFRNLQLILYTCTGDVSGCRKRPWTIPLYVGGGLFLCIAIVLIRRRLVGRFWMYSILFYLKSGLHIKAVFTSLNRAFLPIISRSCDHVSSNFGGFVSIFGWFLSILGKIYFFSKDRLNWGK